MNPFIAHKVKHKPVNIFTLIRNYRATFVGNPRLNNESRKGDHLQPTDKKEEIELVALCHQGQDTGFTALYNKFARPVYNAICSIYSNIVAAVDIIHDASST